MAQQQEGVVEIILFITFTEYLCGRSLFHFIL